MNIILKLIDVLSRYTEFIDYKIQTEEFKRYLITTLNYILIRI